MDKLFTSVTGGIIAVGAILGVVFLGVFYALGLWKKGKDQEDDRLINILQKTVTELEKTVTKQSTDIEALTKEVQDIKRENKTLKDVLQGRDDKTQEFYKQGFEAMKLAHDTHDAVTTMAESMKNSTENTTRLINLLEKHLQVIDHSIKP